MKTTFVITRIKQLISSLIYTFKRKSFDQKVSSIWISESKVRHALNISKTELDSIRKKGDLNYTQIGNKYFFKGSDILSLLNKNYNKKK